jgi:hypothetical protein
MGGTKHIFKDVERRLLSQASRGHCRREGRDEGDPGALVLTRATGPTMAKACATPSRVGTGLALTTVDAEARTGEAEVMATEGGGVAETRALESRAHDHYQRPAWIHRAQWFLGQ